MSILSHVVAQAAAFTDINCERSAKKSAKRSNPQGLPSSFSSDKLASLIKQVGSAKALDDGKLLHSHICKFLGVHSTFVGNCLVEMYGDCGDLLDAASTFDLISEVNLYSWNILINAYAKNGHGKEALETYQAMLNCGFSPSPHTYVCILNAIDPSVPLNEVWGIHSEIIENGYLAQVIVCTALLSVYAKRRSFVHANILFRHIPVKDVISWNAMLAACNESDNYHETFSLFEQMQHEGFEPNHITFTCVVDACGALGLLQKGKELYNLAIGSGYIKNQFVGNALVNMFGRCRSLEDAKNVFFEMPRRDVISWSSIIGACVQNDNCKEGLELFYKMQGGDVEPNSVTFVCAIEACSGTGLLNDAKAIHSLVSKSRYAKDVTVLSSLIIMYGKCMSPDKAKCVFDEILEPSVSTWNAMMSMYAQMGQYENDLQFFTRMQQTNSKPNAITFVCALDACTSLRNLQEGQKINDLVANSAYKDDVMVTTALIRMFGACGHISNAEATFQAATQRDVILWSAMIAACAHSGCDERALELFYQMQQSNVKPDSVTYVSALNVCSNLAYLKEGLVLHMEVVKLGYEKDLQVTTALVDMYGKCGNLDSARKVSTTLGQWDFVMWNTIITAYAQNGGGEEAISLFFKMLDAGVKPDGITFISVLSACNLVGNVNKGKRLFAMMTKYGIQHTTEHCTYMVDLLGRAGHIDDAEKLIDTLPSEKCTKLWHLLLGACCSHGNVEQAKRVADRALQIDPNDPTPYVLLSNMSNARNVVSEVAVS